MTLQSDAQHLIRKVSSIQREYAKLKALSGENFNLFHILQIGSKEVQTHSRFIAELLDPSGRHGMGDTFFRLFLSVLDKDWYEPYNDQSPVQVRVEKITEEGYIDIVVQYTNTEGSITLLIIENKIYAGDQPAQLHRYWKWGCRETGKDKVPLFYLTLNGREPSEQSRGEVRKEDCYLISYQHHILKWLEACIKEAATVPLLREAIHHYINLIKDMTGQSYSAEEDKAFYAAITQSGRDLMAASAIYHSYEIVKKQFIDNFFQEVGKRIIEKMSEFSLKQATYQRNPSEAWLLFFIQATDPFKFEIHYGKDRAVYIGLWMDGEIVKEDNRKSQYKNRYKQLSGNDNPLVFEHANYLSTVYVPIHDLTIHHTREKNFFFENNAEVTALLIDKRDIIVGRVINTFQAFVSSNAEIVNKLKSEFTLE